MTETTKDYVLRRHKALWNERSSFDSHWQAISQAFMPRQSRFMVTDTDKGDRRNQDIINSAGTRAARTARAGLFSGLMSPTRPWFSLETVNSDLMESQAVKTWAYDVERLIRSVFNQSNLYTMAQVLLTDIVLYGTPAMAHLDNFDDVCRFYSLPVGSFALAQDDDFRVNSMTRRLQFTTEQMVAKFGKNVCRAVMNAYDKGNYNVRWTVIHLIEPNREADSAKAQAKFKPFRAIYVEEGGDSKDQLLEDKGFDEFPVHAPRWDVTGEDVYATDCPGMTALGDVRGLQVAERRLAQAIDKIVDPPLVGPPGLSNSKIRSMPGGVTIFDGDPSRAKLEPLYVPQPHVGEMRASIQDMERRINEAFYADLFMSIANMEGVQPQNQLFLRQQQEEKLLMLGPMLERFHGEFLDPLITRVYAQCDRAGILPPMPPELEGQPVRVQYISSLAMAQRAVTTGNIERLTYFIGGLAGMGTAAMDKFDADQAIDEWAQAAGVPPRLIRPDDEAEKMRAARAQQEQMANAASLANSAADTTNKLAGAQMADPSALTALAGALGR